ncbi:MAG: PAS domain S-box protein [Planctomycetota bacterium]
MIRAGDAEDAALLQFLTESVRDLAVVLLDVDGKVLTWSAGAGSIKGYQAEEIIGRHFACFYPAEDIAAGRPALLLGKALADGRHEETGRRVRKDGTEFEAHVVLVPRYDSQKSHVGFAKLTRDVTALVQAAATERRLRQFVDVVRDTMIDGLIVIDMTGNIRVFNRAAEQIFGYSADEVIGQNLKMLMTNPTRDAHDGHLQRYHATGKRSIIGTAREVTARRKDGTTLPITISVGEARFEDETIFVGIIHDLTAQKAVEGELRQSQRLDAIGKLTGGIAHDFNNILMVIMGDIEAMVEKGVVDPQMQRRLDRIATATQRAADLTRQLLAFARKQPLQPLPTSLNDVVVATGKLLGRALGEHIEIDSILADDLWTTSIDRAQLESALVNLAINARDAMPEGGRLMIETGNAVLDEDYVRVNPEAVPGEYAMLVVSDSGHGIPPDVLEHVFEPFYTTKEAGKGTGLGLSMVYGFIKQSNGHIKIYSEVGHGTAIRIYLPRSHAPATKAESVTREITPRGSERILVVEDDDDVRESVVSQLLSLGYVIEEARNGAEGLDRVTRDGPYDLLLTDVVMPGPINGRALADAARQHQASLRVLFMSGYTENAIIHHGRLDPGARLLNKPFRKIDLARAVRDALDSAEEGGAA